jgi:hypothetical protein
LALCAKVNNPTCRVPHRVELSHRLVEQGSADAEFLQIGMHRERPKEANASPPRREARAGQFSINLGCERGDVSGTVTAISVISIGPEGLRIGSAEESAEGETENSRRIRQIGFIQRAHDRLAGLRNRNARGSR